MADIKFPNRFRQAMMVCRYCAYFSFAGLTAAHAWLVANASPAVLLYFLLAPGLLHGALLHLRTHVAWIAVHVFEAVTLTWVLTWSAPAALAKVAAVVLLASNTALWGLSYSPLFLVMVCTPLLAQFDLALATHIPLFDSAAMAVGLVCLLVICHVVHSHTRHLADTGKQLRRQRHVLLRYLPADFPSHLSEEQQAAVREEWVSVAFVDVVGFTQLMNTLPVNVSQQVLNQFLVAVSAHVRCWDGEVSKFLGDGVLCVFAGSPQSSAQNLASQALRCMYLLSAVLDTITISQQPSLQLSIRVGIASGCCQAGHWGGENRADFTVLGGPVNLASRLQQAAGPGQVLLDEKTANLAQNTLPILPAQSLDIKGFGVTPVWCLPSQRAC